MDRQIGRQTAGLTQIDRMNECQSKVTFSVRINIRLYSRRRIVQSGLAVKTQSRLCRKVGVMEFGFYATRAILPKNEAKT